EDAAHGHLPARCDGAAPSGLFSVCGTRLRARYPVPDLRRSGLRCVQAERLGGVAALRIGEPECAAHERHRPGRVGRLRLRFRSDAPGDDALRHRRYPPFAGWRSQVPGAILTLKFSYNWIRELVEGLDCAPASLEK